MRRTNRGRENRTLRDRRVGAASPPDELIPRGASARSRTGLLRVAAVRLAVRSRTRVRGSRGSRTPISAVREQCPAIGRRTQFPAAALKGIEPSWILIDSEPTSPDVPRARRMNDVSRGGAGGSRTLVAGLPSQHSATELRPRDFVTSCVRSEGVAPSSPACRTGTLLLSYDLVRSRKERDSNPRRLVGAHE